jgi:Alr-MurF fusion protein
MTGYSIKDISVITKGSILRNDLPDSCRITRISIDSRTVLDGEGTLFFALKGRHNNGHLYLDELTDRGVKVFLVSEPVKLRRNNPVAIIQAENPLEALWSIAAFHRSTFNYPVIAITGSNGKTVVKEWLHDLLRHHYSIVRSPKSYNSQVGVPLSVWNMHDNNNLGIFEAGISMPGEMARLERIIRPTIGIFTNLGDAHQENFSSTGEKLAEKLTLFRSAEKLIFCTDQPEVAIQTHKYCQSNGITAVDWTLTGEKACISFSAHKENGKTVVSASWNGELAAFSIPFTDSSAIENACNCFAAIIALDLPASTFTSGFTELAPLAMRLEIKKGSQNSLIINDYYNSDINALEIALSVLNHQAEKNSLRKVVILSDIRQSGYSPGDLYHRVNQMLINAQTDMLIGIGHDLKQSEACFTLEKHFFEQVTDFLHHLTRFDFGYSALLIKGAREFRFEEISSALQQKAHQTIFEVNLNTLVENLNIFRTRLKPETRIMVMVKAFSYGTGDIEIAKMLQYQRVDALAVAVTDEGVELRNAGITLPVVVMNPEFHSFQLLTDYFLEPNIYSAELAEGIGKEVKNSTIPEYPVHIKIDTGMNRLGFKSKDDLNKLCSILVKYPQLKIMSVFSHLAASDDPEFDSFTMAQIQRFEELTNHLRGKLSAPFERHMLNSAGIERFPQFQYEMVRLGIGLYGISATGLPLKPIGILKSTISQIKRVETDETIGYSRSGKIDRPSDIAIIPVGYADGLDRRLGNRIGSVFIRNRKVPLIGNICMDMCMADVTGLDAQAGDEVEFIGHNLRIEEMAASINTIPYEILTGISQRVKRVYIQE